MKPYCSRCKYYYCTMNSCKVPVDNWLAPDAPSNFHCGKKNANNDCKDFKLTVDSKAQEDR